MLIDATIVRMVLVPATMELLGKRNWWIPKWIDRIMPNIEIEGHAIESVLHPSDDGSSGDGPEDEDRQPELV